MSYLVYSLMTLLMLTGLFLIGLILLQRGRGGGLVGALGGRGGDSAFGPRAGDVFTKITIAVFFVWVFLSAGSVVALNRSERLINDSVLRQEAAQSHVISVDAESSADKK